jgi:hypothetical protein
LLIFISSLQQVTLTELFAIFQNFSASSAIIRKNRPVIQPCHLNLLAKELWASGA